MNRKMMTNAVVVGILLMGNMSTFAEENTPPILLRQGWLLQSASQVTADGSQVSTKDFTPKGWFATSVPCTVLTALTRNGVYPDLRVGLNAFRIPDASDEFNAKYNLAKFSHLPDKRNPWKDPYWYRTEFTLPTSVEGRLVWLNFKGINYRADVWLNGVQIADREQVVGSFSRYRFDITSAARAGKNYLAVKIYPVDHPGVPDTQLAVLGNVREFHKEIMKDVTLMYSIGYDCMPTVSDRTIGIWQDVSVETTGPVVIRDPFVVTDLPLPRTDEAYLTLSAELVNATQSPQKGLFEVRIADADVSFERAVMLAPGETKQLVFSPENTPQLTLKNPRLWWPRNCGPQNLYHMSLKFRIDKDVSDCQPVTFGVRKITKELYKLDGAHGLRLHVNGQRIFCRGGYIQPEVMHDWDAQRMETEVRYLTEANMNLAYFEDVSNPPDAFLEACDKYGLLFGNCFYGCFWMTPGTEYPTDLELLERSTIDIIKRYRNHPSLVLYMAMNEGDTRKEVYEIWQKRILALDGTRLCIPSGSFPDFRKDVPAWIKKDTPVGMNDAAPKSYGWQESAQYYRWVRENRDWMFKMESGSPSLPPVDSLRRFLPDLWKAKPGELFPLTENWAHHGANYYYKPYDEALRRLYGVPTSVEDYCMKAHLVTADQHRALFEAANHRMWDITSGFTEWKLNACWPSVEWQIYDWYLRPMVSYYYIKNACAPLHIQLSPLDSMVTLVNNRFESKANLVIEASVYDMAMKLRWQKRLKSSVAANSYKDVFAIESIPDLTPVYFVKLEAKDGEKTVCDNFYWLSSQEPADLTELKNLPAVELKTSSNTKVTGDAVVVRASVTNPSDQLAFFVHLAATRGPHGEEILPVFWEDNYFSLLPGESKEVSATLSAKDVGEATPTLEAGGWNVRNPFDCTSLDASKHVIQPDEPFSVTATIANTFIDGSCVELLVDGLRVDSHRIWSRGQAGRKVDFTMKLREQGTHRIAVGNQTVTVTVK